MGLQEVQRLQATSNQNGLTHEMQARCQQVAAELRFMGDTLETSYSQGTTFSSRGKIFIGFTLLGIVTNIAMRYFVRILASNSWFDWYSNYIMVYHAFFKIICYSSSVGRLCRTLFGAKCSETLQLCTWTVETLTLVSWRMLAKKYTEQGRRGQGELTLCNTGLCATRELCTVFTA